MLELHVSYFFRESRYRDEMQEECQDVDDR